MHRDEPLALTVGYQQPAQRLSRHPEPPVAGPWWTVLLSVRPVTEVAAISRNQAWPASVPTAGTASVCYTVPSNRRCVFMTEDHGHLLSEGQVDEIGRIVGQYHATLHTMI